MYLHKQLIESRASDVGRATVLRALARPAEGSGRRAGRRRGARSRFVARLAH